MGVASSILRWTGFLTNAKARKLTVRWFVASILVAALVITSWVWIDDPVFSRTLAIAGFCLVLWLTEVVPPYVPTPSYGP